jgi:hypothetical protein
MGTVHESQRQILISGVPQADYDTPTDTTDPTDYVQLQVTDKNMSKYEPMTSDNAEDAHGSEFATEEYLEGWDAEAQHNIALSSEMIGRLLLLAFGSVVTTQPNSVTAPTVYQHVFTLQDPTVSRQLPTTSLIEIIGTALNRQLPSNVVDNLSLKGDGAKRVDTSFQLIGSGKVVEPSGLSVAQALAQRQSGLHYLYNSQATAKISDAGTLANLVNYGTAKRFRSWEFGINNNHLKEEGYMPGADKFQSAADRTSGAIRAECLFGIRQLMASQVSRLLSQSDEMAALRARKALDWALVLKGGLIAATYYHQLTIHCPKVRYETVELSSGNGLVTQQIKMKPFDDGTGLNPVTATLVNTVQSYT